MIGKDFHLQPLLYLTVITMNGSRETFFYSERLFDLAGVCSGAGNSLAVLPLNESVDAFCRPSARM